MTGPGCLAILALAGCIQAQQLLIQPSVAKIEKAVGANLALTCRPNGQDPNQYHNLEWRDPRNHVINTKETFQEIYIQHLAAEKGVVVIFNGLKERHEGNYTCQANYANSIPLSKSIALITYVDVTFLDAPENQYPVVGKPYKIKCKVSGKPPPIVDWHKGVNPIITKDRYVVEPDGLLITNVTEADDGDYKCTAVVTDTGAFKVRNIKVEVQIPPVILPMEPMTVVEGESATLNCKATGKPPPTYTWIKEKERQDLSKADRFHVNKNTGELYVSKVEFNDDGIYQCVAENTVDRVETTVRVNVLVKPQIYELWNVTESIKNQVTLLCKVKGRPPPDVTFRKLNNKEVMKIGRQPLDNRIILERDSDSEKGEAYGKLSIANLSRSDDGLYECVANNSAGEAYKNGHITVKFPPTFARTKDLPPVWTWKEKPGNLSCLPEAIPNATIVWRWNAIEINEENMAKGFISHNNFRVDRRGPQAFLIVTPYNERRFYTHYECIATNELGQDSIKIELKQASEPKPPSQVRAIQITATTIKFSIVPPGSYDGPPIRSYTIQYRPDRQMSWDYAYNHTWSAGAPYILEGLVPEGTYHFRVAARNDVGMGGYLNADTITMPTRSVPAEPRILVSHQDTTEDNSSSREISTVSPYADHFELRWSVPADNGDPIQHYIVKYCMIEKVTGEWRELECSEPQVRSPQDTRYELNDLRPDTVYKIELKAHNSMGDSSTALLRVRTARGVDPVVPVLKPAMSSTAIVGIVVAAIIIVLLIVDLACCILNKAGMIALCFYRNKPKKTDEEDPKLSRDELEPLKAEQPMRVEYDGQRVYSKSGEIIGKHSAV